MEPSSVAAVPCGLQYVANLVGGCPDERCPLWEPGSTVYDGRCVYDELSIPDRPTFESWLVALRTELNGARSADERTEVRRLFRRLLDESAGGTEGRGASLRTPP